MMNIRIYLLCLAVVLAVPLSAAEMEKFYYVGEARLSSPTGQSFGSQAFLLEKIHDPTNSLIIERAVVAKPDGGVEDHTMTMKVKGNAFTIADVSQTVSGTGRLFGPAWKWTYFKADYESTNGAKIEDENFMTDPGVLVARKTIRTPDGKIVMHMDITLKAATPQTFTILAGALLKKAAASALRK